MLSLPRFLILYSVSFDAYIKSFEDLPVMLNINEVANVLGIGLTKAYELSRRKDFPAFNIGTRRLVPREKLLAWIEMQMTEKVSI